MSERTVRWILHQDLNFYPYKITVVQELQELDFAWRLAFAKAMWEKIIEDRKIYVLILNKSHFNLNGMLINTSSVIGPQLTLRSFINGLFTTKG